MSGVKEKRKEDMKRSQQYVPVKGSKVTFCFLCDTKLLSGEIRYNTASPRLKICEPCFKQWDEIGGRLGDIPRAQKKNTRSVKQHAPPERGKKEIL